MSRLEKGVSASFPQTQMSWMTILTHHDARRVNLNRHQLPGKRHYIQMGTCRKILKEQGGRGVHQRACMCDRYLGGSAHWQLSSSHQHGESEDRSSTE